MRLTYEELIKFNLTEIAEKELIGKSDRFLDFIKVIQGVNSIDAFIKESPSYPGSTDKIVRDEMISAIGATLAIEGTAIGEDEIKESFRKADLKEKLMNKEQEAENSRKVYGFIQDLVKNNKENFQYSEAIIKQIHKYFTDEIEYMGNIPGDYRGDFPVTFGSPRRKGICRTRIEVELAMSNFVKWLNKDQEGMLEQMKVVKAMMAHYYLTEIHPFGDGNGRTARATEALVLYVNGINHYCFWSLANFWSINKDKYLVYLRDIYETSNPLSFIEWGLKGYLEELGRIKARVLKKVKQLMLMDYAKYLLSTKRKQKIKINQRVVDVLRLLIKWDKVSFNKFANSPEIVALYRGVSQTTKYRDIKKMIQLEIINIVKIDDVQKESIEPNFNILESLSYNV